MIKLPSLKNCLPKSMKDQKGASAIEYAVLVGIVALVIVAVVGGGEDGALGEALTTAFDSVTDAVNSATAGTGE